MICTALVAAALTRAPPPLTVRVPAPTVTEPVVDAGAATTKLPVEPVYVVEPATTGWFVSVRAEEPAMSLLNVAVVFTDRATLPPRVAALLNVMALPARTTGSGPPARVTALARVTPPALLTLRTPLDSDTNPV